MRLKRSIDVDAADLAPLFHQVMGAVPIVIAGLRRLAFVDGAVVHPDTGERREGLRDVDGTHPQPGSRYAVVMADESLQPDGPWAAEMAAIQERPVAQRGELLAELIDRHRQRAAAEGLLDVSLFEAEVELLHDDAGQFAIRVVSVGETSFAADAAVTRPARPDELTVDVIVPITERFVAGDLVMHAVVDIGSIPGGMVSRPQVRVDARHRRGRLGVVAKTTDRPGGRWNVDVAVSARGSGWIRPVAAVGLFIGRRKMRQYLDETLGDSIERFEIGLSEALAAEPLPTADDIVADIIGGVATNIDEARRLAAVRAPVIATFTLRASPPARCPRWAWRSSAPDLDVAGRPVAVDWGADQAVEIDATGSWIETQDWKGVGGIGRTSVRVLVRPGDIVEYRERWWSFLTPRLGVVGRRRPLDVRP